MPEIENELDVASNENTVEFPDEVVEPDEGKETTPDPIDYQADLDRVKRETEERLGKKLDKERQKRIEAENLKGLSPDEVEALVEKKTAELDAKYERKFNENKAFDEASKLASSPAERDLMLHHYNSTIVPSGNLADDMERAYAIVNSKKLQSRVNELRAAAQSKQNRSGVPEAGEAAPRKDTKYSEEDLELSRDLKISPEKAKEVRLKTEKLRRAIT